MGLFRSLCRALGRLQACQNLRVDERGTHAGNLAFDGLLFGSERLPTNIVHAAHLPSQLGQSQIGIVLAQTQAILGSAGEHPVGFLHALGEQVVQHHAHVRLVSAGHPGLLALNLARGIQTGQQALRSGFLVTSRAVDLACEEQTLNLPGFQAGLQPARIEVVILDGVAGAQDVRLLQADHGVHDGQLRVERQAGGDAVGVDLVCLEPFGLQVDLVRILVREAVDLVLDGGAIAGPHAFDDAGEERRTIQRLANDLVRARVGVRDPARQLPRVLVGTSDEGEYRHRIQITRLDAQPAVIDGLAVDARRRAGLETPLRQGQFPKAGRQRLG